MGKKELLTFDDIKNKINKLEYEINDLSSSYSEVLKKVKSIEESEYIDLKLSTYTYWGERETIYMGSNREFKKYILSYFKDIENNKKQQLKEKHDELENFKNNSITYEMPKE